MDPTCGIVRDTPRRLGNRRSSRAKPPCQARHPVVERQKTSFQARRLGGRSSGFPKAILGRSWGGPDGVPWGLTADVDQKWAFGGRGRQDRQDHGILIGWIKSGVNDAGRDVGDFTRS